MRARYLLGFPSFALSPFTEPLVPCPHNGFTIIVIVFFLVITVIVVHCITLHSVSRFDEGLYLTPKHELTHIDLVVLLDVSVKDLIQVGQSPNVGIGGIVSILPHLECLGAFEAFDIDILGLNVSINDVKNQETGMANDMFERVEIVEGDNKRFKVGSVSNGPIIPGLFARAVLLGNRISD